jgi:hypothetical protein
MVRFEEELSKHADRKLDMPKRCATIGVAERTLLVCCAELLGVSLMVQPLNKARSALRCANPSKATVAEIDRNHDFRELETQTYA